MLSIIYTLIFQTLAGPQMYAWPEISFSNLYQDALPLDRNNIPASNPLPIQKQMVNLGLVRERAFVSI